MSRDRRQASDTKQSRETYMRDLKQELRRLPKEDFDAALAYFEEYFDDAGEDNEQQAILDLGSPRQAASELIVSLAVKNSKEPAKSDVKKGVRSVWVGMLAVFAAPIALPLAFAMVVLIASLGLTVVMFLFSVGLTGVAVFLGGAVSVVAGAVTVFQAPADAVANIGVGFLLLGMGIVIAPACYDLCRKALKGITGIFGRMVKKFAKGGVRNEEN